MYADQKTNKLVKKKKLLNLKKKKMLKKKIDPRKKIVQFRKKKHSTPEIPAWSPTAVLIGPNGA